MQTLPAPPRTFRTAQRLRTTVRQFDPLEAIVWFIIAMMAVTFWLIALNAFAQHWPDIRDFVAPQARDTGWTQLTGGL